MKTRFVTAVAALMLAAPLAAQQNGLAARITAQVGTRFAQADCPLKENDFRVSSGKTRLSSALGQADPVKAGRLLTEGAQVITDAIINSGQAKNPAAWYWLARIDLYLGDVPGADSAFTRAEALAPQCAGDIARYRSKAWAGLVAGAQESIEAKQTDSAEVFFRAAGRMWSGAPHAYVGLAGIFYDRGQVDSAIAYYGLAAGTTTTDSSYIRVRDRAAFNQGVLLANNNRPAEASRAFRRYLAWRPDDLVAKRALAQSFRAASMIDSAQAVERELLSATPAAGQAGGQASEGMSEGDLFDLAVRQFGDKNYADAAATFGRINGQNPFSRDALFNQANAYLALQDGPSLAATAEKLVALEPLSEYDFSMRAQGYKFAGNTDKLFAAIVAREALPVNLAFEQLRLRADGASLAGTATGREARDENNKLLPTHPVTITVEFMAPDGTVVGAQDITIPVLKAGETMSVTAEGQGQGIRGYRYRVK